jgi:hypothetical protein
MLRLSAAFLTRVALEVTTFSYLGHCAAFCNLAKSDPLKSPLRPFILDLVKFAGLPHRREHASARLTIVQSPTGNLAAVVDGRDVLKDPTGIAWDQCLQINHGTIPPQQGMC